MGPPEVPVLRRPLAQVRRAAQSARRRLHQPRDQPVWLDCGVRVIADRHERQWDRLARRRTHERDVEAFFVDWLRGGDRVVDVGANCGLLACLAGRLVGPTGQVLAVEPDAITRRTLTRSLRTNDVPWVTVAPVAAGATQGTATLLRPDAAWGGFLAGSQPPEVQASFFPTSHTASTPVPQVPLDALVADWPAVHLLKIDVDGPELAVLQGARATLRRHRPAVVTEVSAFYAEHGVDPARVIDLLMEERYTLWGTRRGALRATRVRSAQDVVLADQADAVNLFALPKGAFEDRAAGTWLTR